MEARPGSFEDSGDLLSKIELAWARSLSAWPTFPDAGYDAAQLADVAGRVAASRRHLRELITLIGKATIPYRLERWLEDVRVGGQLDFADAFSEELPSARDRREILRFMSAAPAPSLGLIDRATGRVYRISRSRLRQWRSYGAMALVAAAGAALMWVLAVLGPTWGVNGWPFSDPGELLSAYVFVLAGALLHIIVDALKQERQAGADGGLVALDDVWLWGHVREKSILVVIVALVVVTIGLSAVPGVEMGFLTALFAGYSFDSIIDLVLKRFETFSNAQLTRLKDALEEADTGSQGDDDA